ncbi:MAG: hypothetical protein LQ341_002729 [Variospora aurantia]|nr:MAG: hypothetical protein LQ341_002729 [Variospora aurantia]
MTSSTVAEFIVRARCKSCHKLKPIDAYSNKQQLDLKQRIAGHQGERARLPTAEIITCRPCTGGQVTELTCCICNKTQGLEAFGKTQRKTPDRAVIRRLHTDLRFNTDGDKQRCIVCVYDMGREKWAHVEWQAEESEEDDSEDEFGDRSVTNPYEASSYRHDDGDGSLSAPFREIDLARHDNVHGESVVRKSPATEPDLLQSYNETELTTGNAGKGKGKENASAWQNFAGGSRGKQGKEFTGYDSKGGAHHQIRTPSTAASEESLEIVTDGFRGRSKVSQVKGSNSRFAKAPRGPSPSLPKDSMVEKLKAARMGHTVSYSDNEEESDDEWGHA